MGVIFLNTRFSLILPSARRRAGMTLAACAALALGACSAPQKQPAPPAPPAVAAPQPAPPQPQAPAQAQQQAAVQALLERSDATLRMIDEDRMDAVWASLAPFVAGTRERGQFVAGLRSVRGGLGTVNGRSRAGVQGVRVGPESKMPPPGQYANVEYLSQLANGRKVIEKLSFRQEQDGWRFVGYEARNAQ